MPFIAEDRAALEPATAARSVGRRVDRVPIETGLLPQALEGRHLGMLGLRPTRFPAVHGRGGHARPGGQLFLVKVELLPDGLDVVRWRGELAICPRGTL